jgi:hypothetical protein
VAKGRARIGRRRRRRPEARARRRPEAQARRREALVRAFSRPCQPAATGRPVIPQAHDRRSVRPCGLDPCRPGLSSLAGGGSRNEFQVSCWWAGARRCGEQEPQDFLQWFIMMFDREGHSSCHVVGNVSSAVCFRPTRTASTLSSGCRGSGGPPSVRPDPSPWPTSTATIPMLFLRGRAWHPQPLPPGRNHRQRRSCCAQSANSHMEPGRPGPSQRLRSPLPGLVSEVRSRAFRTETRGMGRLPAALTRRRRR